MAYCANCGTEAATGARFCTNCGANIDPEASRPAPSFGEETWDAGLDEHARPVPNYLTQAILVTVFTACFCFPIPLGITAIVFASQATSKQTTGDYPGALEAASRAKLFCWITLGVALALLLIGLLTPSNFYYEFDSGDFD